MPDQLDYLFFVYGFAFLLMAALAAGVRGRTDERLPWGWLASFGLAHGLHEWLEMASLGLPPTPALHALRLALLAGSFLLLLEFGRRGGRALGGWMPAAWIHLPLLGLAALGGLGGVAGLDAACRYALGLPAALLAGWTLCRAARSKPAGQRWPPALAGATLLAYAVATGLVPPQAPFFPAAWLNQERFLAFVGIPIQFFRTLCALGMAAGIWRLYRQTAAATTDSAHRFQRRLFAGTGALLLLTGWWAANWRGKTVDAEMRTRLVDQAIAIARTVTPEEAAALSFTAADATHPVFLRIGANFAAYGQAIGLRSIYTFALRHGQIVFGPESLAEADPWASPPGTAYQTPAPEDWQILRGDLPPHTQGPRTDEYGTFVSALAPVNDRQTGVPLMVVGLDIAAGEWQAYILRARLTPIVFTLAMLTTLLAGGLALLLRERLVPERQQLLRHTETAVAAACGLALTAAVVYLAHDGELRLGREQFRQQAQAQATAVSGAVQDLLDTHLAGLARFCEANSPPAAARFHAYAAPLARRRAAIQFYPEFNT